MSTAGARFDDLIRIMATLRGPGGCPWDRVQTLATLRPFLLEETYEALEALDTGDSASLREELGDLLFEIVFLSRIAEEQGDFTIADAIDGVAQKLVRRHPHVFGDADKLSRPEEVLGRWEELKAAERAAAGVTRTKTLLSGVPIALPALLRAYEYSTRAATVGFDWVHAADVLDKMEEELREIRDVVDATSTITTARGARREGAKTFSRKRSAICSSRLRTCRGSSASSPRPRYGAPTTSSGSASPRWNSGSRHEGNDCRTRRLRSWKPSGSG